MVFCDSPNFLGVFGNEFGRKHLSLVRIASAFHFRPQLFIRGSGTIH